MAFRIPFHKTDLHLSVVTDSLTYKIFMQVNSKTFNLKKTSQMNLKIVNVLAVGEQGHSHKNQVGEKVYQCGLYQKLWVLVDQNLLQVEGRMEGCFKN